MTAALALEGVSKRFGDVHAVDDVSLEIGEGAFVALLGASGCGKSTTLRLMAGLDRPDAGRVRMGGRDVTADGASARNIALMFQSYALYPHLTVHQNIATPLRQRRLSALGRLPGAGALRAGLRQRLDAIDAEVRRVAEMLRLETLLGRKPGQLSGGQQQRVALARALVREPAAFLLDEPLSNLDTQLRADTREEIKALHRRTGHPFVLVTHDQADALSMADRVAVMIEGRIAQVAPPDVIFSRPANRGVAAFIGAHPMNLIGPGGLAAALHPAGRDHVVGIRPEQLALTGDGPAEAVMRSTAYQGDRTILRLVGGAEEALQVVLPLGSPAPAEGETLRLAADPGALHLFDAASGARIEHAGGPG
ncbi:MAG: ABC transporter ATP-binding protein [Pseudomonadota bacterium]